MAGSRIVSGEEEAAGEVVIRAAEVAGDAAKAVIKERAGDLGVRVRGRAEITHVSNLIMGSMQGVEWK